jgi:hypothetical protein
VPPPPGAAGAVGLLPAFPAPPHPPALLLKPPASSTHNNEQASQVAQGFRPSPLPCAAPEPCVRHPDVRRLPHHQLAVRLPVLRPDLPVPPAGVNGWIVACRAAAAEASYFPTGYEPGLAGELAGAATPAAHRVLSAPGQVVGHHGTRSCLHPHQLCLAGGYCGGVRTQLLQRGL